MEWKWFRIPFPNLSNYYYLFEYANFDTALLNCTLLWRFYGYSTWPSAYDISTFGMNVFSHYNRLCTTCMTFIDILRIARYAHKHTVLTVVYTLLVDWPYNNTCKKETLKTIISVSIWKKKHEWNELISCDFLILLFRILVRSKQVNYLLECNRSGRDNLLLCQAMFCFPNISHWFTMCCH